MPKFVIFKVNKEEFDNEIDFMKKAMSKDVFEGSKQFYDCKYCPNVRYYIFYDNSELSEKFFICGEHSDVPHKSNEEPIPTSIKAVIKEIYFSGLTRPMQIQGELDRRGLGEISTSKLKNYLVKLRTEKYGAQVTNFAELEEWQGKHLDAASDCDGIVLSFTSNPAEKSFTMVLTTEILLQNLHLSSLVQADGTYKLNHKGFPTIVVGTSDRSRVIL